MKYRELLEGQSEESSIATMSILQSDNETYQKVMNDLVAKIDQDIPQEILKQLIENFEDYVEKI